MRIEHTRFCRCSGRRSRFADRSSHAVDRRPHGGARRPRAPRGGSAPAPLIAMAPRITRARHHSRRVSSTLTHRPRNRSASRPRLARAPRRSARRTPPAPVRRARARERTRASGVRGEGGSHSPRARALLPPSSLTSRAHPPYARVQATRRERAARVRGVGTRRAREMMRGRGCCCHDLSRASARAGHDGVPRARAHLQRAQRTRRGGRRGGRVVTQDYYR